MEAMIQRELEHAEIELIDVTARYFDGSATLAELFIARGRLREARERLEYATECNAEYTPVSPARHQPPRWSGH